MSIIPNNIVISNYNLVVMFLTFAGQSFKIFNRVRAIRPKGCQRGNLGKSQQNGDYT